ncbi:MAG: PIN domain-containing protein, partial [Solirubrobacteraceae bacterium]
EAERRIAARDPDDWPTVALALTLNLPVWSQDKDLISAGPRRLHHGRITRRPPRSRPHHMKAETPWIDEVRGEHRGRPSARYDSPGKSDQSARTLGTCPKSSRYVR